MSIDSRGMGKWTLGNTHTHSQDLCPKLLFEYMDNKKQKPKKKKPKDFHSKIMNIFLLQFNFLNKCVSKHTMTLRTLRFVHIWLSISVYGMFVM